MSLFYHVVQPSFHDRQWYPFVDTETKRAYTIMKAVFINHIIRELKQQRFWGTNVNRKLTFSINGQWFGSNSRVNRLYKRKENYHYKFVSVKTYKKGEGLTSGWRTSLRNVFA